MLLLCIDDDPEDVELFQEAIKIIDDSTTCVIAMNGLEGIDILNRTIPDYIFLDINMPVMDGKETLKRIRKDKRLESVPVVILSTSNDKKEVQACRDLGADHWFTKPGSFNQLVEELREALSL